MRRTLCLRIALFVCALVAFTAEAVIAQVEDIEYKSSDNKVSIAVSGSATEPEELIMLVVLKKDVSEEEYNSVRESERFKMIDYVRETRSESNKKWTVKFELDGSENDRRIIRIHEDKSEKLSVFSLYGKSDAVSAVNNANESEMSVVLDKYDPFLNYRNNNAYKQLFLGFDKPYRDYVYMCLGARNDFTSVDEIDTAFDEYTAMAIFAKAQGYEQIYKNISASADILKLDLSEYNGLSEYKRVRVCSKIMDAFENKIFTKSELQSKIDSLSKTEKEIEPSGGNSGGGGGGSSGTSGGTGKNMNFNAPSDTSELIDNKSVYFDDLQSVEWARESIETLASRNILNGKGNKIFAPDENVTREEFVKMIVAAFGVENSESRCDFKDVSPEMWCYKYISSAADSGLIQGIGDKMFGIGMPITREDMATILWNGISKKVTAEKGKKFADDDDISDYAKEAVVMLRRIGIVEGSENNMFAPKLNATRAEAAAMLYRTLLVTE